MLQESKLPKPLYVNQLAIFRTPTKNHHRNPWLSPCNFPHYTPKWRPLTRDRPFHLKQTSARKGGEQKNRFSVGGFNPSEKYESKMGIFPNFRDENKKSLKPPSRFPFQATKNESLNGGFFQKLHFKPCRCFKSQGDPHLQTKKMVGKYHWGCESHHPRTSFVQ